MLTACFCFLYWVKCKASPEPFADTELGKLTKIQRRTLLTYVLARLGMCLILGQVIAEWVRR